MTVSKIQVCVAMAGVVALGVQAFASDDPWDVLEAQIEQSAVKVGEKQKEERRVLKELKEEARRRQVEALHKEADAYARNEAFFEAISAYSELLNLDPQSRSEIEKKQDVCMKKLRVSVEKHRKQLEKAKELQQAKLARQILAEKARVVKEEKERKALMENARAAQHFSDSLQGRKDKTARKVEGSDKPDFLYGESIQEGFQKSLTYLDSNDYRAARDEFSKVLEAINELSVKAMQLKTVEQIKQAAQTGSSQVLSDIRTDKYDEAKKRLMELIEKTSLLAREKEGRELQDKNRLLVDSYLKKASEYLEGSEYESARTALEKVIRLDPQNRKAITLLERLEDVISITRTSQ